MSLQVPLVFPDWLRETRWFHRLTCRCEGPLWPHGSPGVNVSHLTAPLEQDNFNLIVCSYFTH